jgi:hypothetical protein
MVTTISLVADAKILGGAYQIATGQLAVSESHTISW